MVSQDEKERKRKRLKRNVIAKSLREGNFNMRVGPNKKGQYKRKKGRVNHFEQVKDDWELFWTLTRR